MRVNSRAVPAELLLLHMLDDLGGDDRSRQLSRCQL